MGISDLVYLTIPKIRIINCAVYICNYLTWLFTKKSVEDIFQWVKDKASLSMDDRLFHPLKD